MMNVSDFLKNRTPRERFLMLFGSGIIIVYLLFYVVSSQEETVSSTQVLPQQQNVVPSKTQTPAENAPVMPLEHQDNQAMRNPFATVPEVKEKGEPTPVNGHNFGEVSPGADGLSAKQGKEPLRLTGLIGTADHHVAVIQTAKKSKAYQVNEFVGSYQLVAIYEDFVILDNAGRQVVLPLESAGQKGGNQSEK